MMKAAAEQPVQMQITPGQAGARQAQRARMGADQLLADFEGLLARQSVSREIPVEKTDEASPDDQAGQQRLASPEILFLALAGEGDFAAPQDKAEEPQELQAPDAGASDVLPPLSDTSMEVIATIVQEPPAVLATPQMAEPQPRAAMKDGEPPAKDKSAVMPKVAASMAPPTPNARPAGEPAAVPAPELAVPEDSRVSERSSATPTVEKKAHATTEEATTLKDMGSSQGATPITLIRVAGQETHFAPSPVFLFDDHKIGALATNAPAGADEPGRAQPAPSPIAVKPPSGPLKTLTVQLGSNELGLINATVALKDKALDLRIGAARDDAVASLRENAGRLTDTLQSLGFSVEGVSVQKMHQADVGNQTGSGQATQQGAAGQDGNGQGQQRDLSGSGFGSNGSARQSRFSSHDDHLAEQDGNDVAQSAGGTRNSRDVFL